MKQREHVDPSSTSVRDEPERPALMFIAELPHPHHIAPMGSGDAGTARARRYAGGGACALPALVALALFIASAGAQSVPDACGSESERFAARLTAEASRDPLGQGGLTALHYAALVGARAGI